MGPARDQGITQWCYAHSAADLVTLRLGRRVSAFDLALTYLLEDETSVITNPHPHVQAWLAREPEFTTRVHRWRQDDPQAYQPDRLLTRFGLYYLGGMDQDAILLSHKRGYCRDEALPGSEALYLQYLENIQRHAIAHCGAGGISQCASTAPARLGDIPSDTSRALAHLAWTWAGDRCGARIFPTDPLTTENFEFAPDLEAYRGRIARGELRLGDVRPKLRAEIDRRLERGDAVAIGYDLSELALADSGDPNESVDHSSVIAARRLMGGQCQYFLRTHLGNVCTYHSSVNHLCDRSQGGVWVTLEQIPSLYAVLSIASP